MRKISFLLLSIVASVTVSLPSDASIQRKQYQSVDLGISAGSVTTIYRKGNDALWVGSQDVLAKLTDSGFRFYYPEAGNVRQILQDASGDVWVLADSALCRFIVLKESFEKMPIAPQCAIELDGNCLFATDGAIYKLSDTGVSEAVSYASQGNYAISKMFKLTADSVLLVDPAAGALIYDCSAGTVSKCAFIPAGVSEIFVDSKQRIWYGMPGEGLFCIDSSGRKIADYSASETSLPSNNVKFLGESGSSIVVFTDAGLCRVQADQGGEIAVENHATGDPASFPTTDVTSMFCDSDGSVWFGRRRGGVFVDRQVQVDAFETQACHIPSISCIYAPASESKVWIGTSGAGVLTYDPAVSSSLKSLSTITATDGMTVGSMADFSDSEIIFTSVGRGFMLLDKHTGSVRHLETGNLILDGFGRDGSSSSYEVCNGPQGSVIMMSGSDMYRYVPATKTFAEIHLPESVSSKSGLFPAFPGGTGLYFWNPNSLYEYDVMSNALVEVIRFQDITILSASASDDGNIWIGSDKGLVSLNRTTRKYEILPLPCGCAVASVLCGPAGRVWAGTAEGLCFYDCSSRKFTSIDPSDGLFKNCYSDRAKSLNEKTGEIYMGGQKGFARIDAGITFPASSTPELVLEAISAGDEFADKAFGSKLTAGNPVTVEVMAKESDILRNRQYHFVVDGPGNYSVAFTSRTPSLTLTDLPVGKYNISASCSLKSGDWTEITSVASFKIARPWYKSYLFYALLLVLLCGALIWHLYHCYKGKTQGTKQSYQTRSSEERLTFLVNISHELRTPLTLTMGPIEKAMSNMSQSDPNYNRLKCAIKQTRKMKTLLDTVLTAAKVESDGVGVKLNLSYQSFNNWVKHIVGDFKEEADARNIKLNVEYDSKIGMLDFDEEKCQVVMSNILMNAFAHNPDDSEIQVWTECHPERAAVRVSVSDRGTGIREEDLSEIFNRFYQETEDNHGFGIGLAYSKQIIDNMQGVLGAYNNSHGGATFYFELPTTLAELPAENSAEKSSAESAPKHVETTQAPAPQRPSVPDSVLTEPVKPRVWVDPNALPFEEPRNIPDPVIDLKNANLLVVEDDVALRNYLKDELSESLNNVYVAGNGVEAIKVLNSENINVVVSDVMMPEMDGFTLCRYIKTTVSVSHIPVILLTARSDENSRLLGYKNGADDYITKPFDLDVLKDSIQRLFFSRESMRQRFSSPLAPMPTAQETTFSSADEKFLEKFAKLVSDNISDPDLDSKFLVDNMGMSRTVLFNKVKQLTGLNLQNYVNKIRMEYVIKLMSTTDLSLGDIAQKSGFSSPRYFSTSFKNYTGVTPTQYKKDHR